MGEAEGLRTGPRLKVGSAAPDRVRRVEGVILAIRAAQQMKGYEAGDIPQMGVSRRPYLLEIHL